MTLTDKMGISNVIHDLYGRGDVYAKKLKNGTMKVSKVRNLKRKLRIALTFRRVKDEVIHAKHYGQHFDASSAYGGRL